MKWFNTNAIHNYLNAFVGLILTGAFTGFDWTLFGMTDHTAMKISGGIMLAKLVINGMRDGLNGMVTAATPPAEEK